jgi:hypothetical protein
MGSTYSIICSTENGCLEKHPLTKIIYWRKHSDKIEQDHNDITESFTSKTKELKDLYEGQIIYVNDDNGNYICTIKTCKDALQNTSYEIIKIGKYNVYDHYIKNTVTIYSFTQYANSCNINIMKCGIKEQSTGFIP